MAKAGLLDRETLLMQAALLIRKETFNHEDNARSHALMTLAERMDSPRSVAIQTDEEQRFDRMLRTGESRQMTSVTGVAGGYLAPEGFREALGVALKSYDALFDPEVSTLYEPGSGYTTNLPILDDTGSASVVVTQAAQASQAPSAVQVAALAVAPTYRTGVVTLSLELLQDAAFDPSGFLATAFGVRHARGVAPALITILLAGAKLGATATGDQNADSPSGATQVGYQDLLALRKSVNPAYRASAKTFWLLNDNTLTAIDGLLDKQGHPMIHPKFDAAGRRLILGYPVGICPSMPDIGASATPIAFGATGNFIVRMVKGTLGVQRLDERFAEYGLIGYQGYMRADGALLCASGADSPVKFLQNAS